MRIYNLDVKLSKQEDGLWRAEVPGLQGCWVDAPTLMQALQDIQGAAALFIDLYIEENRQLPGSASAAGESLKAIVPVIVEEQVVLRHRVRSRSRSVSR
ncbi:MAG TPA: type II toxin-antitoxin system HicB family antitoxin [Dehalococcoidia bacterium]|nr:type II toxin-antitoxin system HicB family antitoxin [Dehalococcoidia bacterium]